MKKIVFVSIFGIDKPSIAQGIAAKSKAFRE